MHHLGFKCNFEDNISVYVTSKEFLAWIILAGGFCEQCLLPDTTDAGGQICFFFFPKYLLSFYTKKSISQFSLKSIPLFSKFISTLAHLRHHPLFPKLFCGDCYSLYSIPLLSGTSLGRTLMTGEMGHAHPSSRPCSLCALVCGSRDWLRVRAFKATFSTASGVSSSSGLCCCNREE